ncbi:MAG: hypothetical protein VKK42_02230 [Lyngbya sp.]|nr:hypothetical protein [Lyngbya sp.]
MAQLFDRFQEDNYQLIFISGSADQTLKIWDVETDQILETWVAHNKDVNTIAIAKNGETLISGGSDNTIKIWRLQPKTL